MSSSFDEFVKSQAKSVPQKDYALVREEWIQDLRQLYDELTDYLRKYVESGDIRLLWQDISINEQLLGHYQAPVLGIAFQGNGNAQVRIIPKGLHVIGAKGRVDLDGPKGSAMLVRVPEDSTGVSFKTYISVGDEDLVREPGNEPEDRRYVWKFSVREPRIRYYPLTKESFQETLLHLIRG